MSRSYDSLTQATTSSLARSCSRSTWWCRWLAGRKRSRSSDAGSRPPGGGRSIATATVSAALRRSRRRSSYATKARGRRRVSRSASSTWRSQSRRPLESENPLRAPSEAATSSGLRIGSTNAARAPNSSSARSQNGTRRQIRGSLRTNGPGSGYSLSSASTIRFRNSSAAGESSQEGGRGATSSHALPTADSSSSLMERRTSDSPQCPSSLLGRGPTGVRGRPKPSSESRRATAEVPLRCIPATTTARRSPASGAGSAPVFKTGRSATAPIAFSTRRGTGSSSVRHDA